MHIDLPALYTSVKTLKDSKEAIDVQLLDDHVFCTILAVYYSIVLFLF